MTKLRQLYSTRQTAQKRPIPRSGQIANSAGGYAWQVDKWTQLDRFLILGSEEGTYYIRPRQLTVENATAVLDCLSEDGQRVVARTVEISQAGRTPKNDPALFVLAMAAGLGDEVTRRAALAALPKVARIGTHLFHFLTFVEGFRGWGRGLRRGVGRWYTQMPAEKLAFQAIKYQQRNGWSHRDALRLAHPRAETAVQDALFHWITQGWEDDTSLTMQPDADDPLRLIWAFEQAKRATSEGEIVALVEAHRLPWEAIPAQWHGSNAVWQALLPTLPPPALLRNLGRLTANGVLAPLSPNSTQVAQRLADAGRLRQARVHPVAVLAALMTYRNGRGTRGKLTWQPVTQIVDALDKAFYRTFETVQPTGKRLLLALDVSGSMGWGTIGGVAGLSPRVGSAAMALVTAAVERQVTTVAFSHQMVPLSISPRQRLDDVVKRRLAPPTVPCRCCGR